MPKRRPEKSFARRAPILLVLAAAPTLFGCSQMVKDLAMAPIIVMQHVAVETAKLPYETAKLGVTSVLDATVGNAERALRSIGP